MGWCGVGGGREVKHYLGAHKTPFAPHYNEIETCAHAFIHSYSTTHPLSHFFGRFFFLLPDKTNHIIVHNFHCTRNQTLLIISSTEFYSKSTSFEASVLQVMYRFQTKIQFISVQVWRFFSLVFCPPF